MKNLVLMKAYEEDRNFLEVLKRKLSHKKFADTLNLLIKEFKKNKLHLDLLNNERRLK